MKKSLLLSCFLLLLTTCFAQTDNVAILKEKLSQDVDAYEIMQTNLDLGQEYRRQGVYLDSAFLFFDKALKLALENDFEEKKPEIYFKIAHTYGIAESWEESAIYFNKTIPFLLEQKSYEQLANTYNNLGNIYFKTNEYEKAEAYFNQAIQTAKINSIEESLPISYIQLAELKLNENKFYEAQKYIDKLKSVELNAITKLTKPLISAKINARLGKLDIALEQALEAKKVAEEQNDMDHSLQSSEVLHSIYEKSGNFISANSALKDAVAIKDAMQDIKRNNEIEKMELKLQLEAQQKEVEALEQQNYYRYLIYIIVTVALLLLTLLILRQMKISKMTEEMYDIQNKLITTELEMRNKKVENASTMDAAKSADSELKDRS